MTRREQLMARIAEAQAQLATVQGQIDDPNTPGSRIPGLENRAANLERRISELNQELANLPEEAMVAAAGLVAVPAAEARKRGVRKRSKPRAPKG